MPPTLPGPMTRDDALAVLRARFSKGDLRMILAQPEGAALIEQILAIGVDTSLRLDRSITARHLLARDGDVSPPAQGAIAATSSVTIARMAGAVGRARIMIASTPVETVDGHVFTLDADLAFAAGEAGPKAAAVTARVPGADSSVPAFSIDRFVPRAGAASGDVASVYSVLGGGFALQRGAGDFFLVELVGLYVQFTAGANAGQDARIVSVSDDGTLAFLDSTTLVAEVGGATWQIVDFDALGFTVTQLADAVPGADDELDALGRELGRQRQTGEPDDPLREALVTLPNVVTPSAIVAIANRILGPYGPVELYEAYAGGADADPVLNSKPWTGCIIGRTAIGIDPWRAKEGLAFLIPSKAFFLLRVKAPGLGWAGGVLFAVGVKPPKLHGRPVGTVIGKSPIGLVAKATSHMMSAIAAQVRTAKGGGVGWAFYPPRDP